MAVGRMVRHRMVAPRLLSLCAATGLRCVAPPSLLRDHVGGHSLWRTFAASGRGDASDGGSPRLAPAAAKVLKAPKVRRTEDLGADARGAVGRAGAAPAATTAFAARARGQGFGDPAPPRAAKPPKGIRSVEITAGDGSMWQVLLGKNAQDNDRLTLELGRPHEVWMHVAGLPGSHAVVRHVPEVASAKGARPPQDAVKKAAAVCAFYSKAKGQATVDVHVTTCGKVSKAPGAPAGQVLLRGGWETLRVRPLDPASLAQSKAKGPTSSNQRG